MPAYKYASFYNMVIDLRKQGRTLQEIEDATGVSQSRASQILKKYGMEHHYDYPINPYNGVSDIWWAEFRGLFLGEGSVGISLKGNFKTRKSLSPYMAIQMRDDESPLLNSIHSVLGGKLFRKKSKGSHPAITWEIHRWALVYSIVIKLVDGNLPGKKLSELQLMKEACEYRFRTPTRLSNEQYGQLYRYYERMRMLKCYLPGEDISASLSDFIEL